MLTLILLRHAKSSWKNPELPDKERTLATRGIRDAKQMGAAIAARDLPIDLVLCSSARRTRDTLALALPELKSEPKIVYEDALYHAAPEAMLKILQEVAPGTCSVMLVGHNPELQQLAIDLIGKGPKLLRDRLEEKLPTAAVVVISFPAGLWNDVDVNSGALSLFLTPKTIGKSRGS